MCGIAGVAGEPDQHAAAWLVGAMTDALARRGPDGAGVESWPNAVLGHRRLAIFDLSDAGAQPMRSPDGRIGVVFNGAVYNFVALREELEGAGFRFRSQTDTEVLVHGYAAWGIDALVARLRGMFAFAMWDDRAGTLHLVRDRLGQKPLAYRIDGGRLAFASTPAALRAAGLCGEIDPEAVAEYLDFGFVTDAHCIYRGVHKLPPASIATFASGTLHLRRYWEPPEAGTDARSFAHIVDEAEAHLLDAVRIRLAADVPVGALLSGGIDSSLVCWAVSQLGGSVTAFTVATPGDHWDESADAMKTAHELGIPHRVIAADPHGTPDVDELIAAYAEPFACASALGMLGVSERVRSEATVLLTGDGGDDVFLGYPRQAAFLRAQRAAERLPAWATSLWRFGGRAAPRLGPLRRAAHFADYASGGLGAITRAHDGIDVMQARGMIGERLAGVRLAHRELPLSASAGRHALDDFLRYERQTRFTGEYLVKVDGGAMYHALEARSPFLDHRLWEFAAALPYETRLHGNTLKAILREIARRRIGERLARGAKRGFGIPATRWIAGKWNARVREAFQESILAKEGWIDAAPVRAAIDRCKPGDTAPVQLWHLFVLECWMRRYGTMSIDRHGVAGRLTARRSTVSASH